MGLAQRAPFTFSDSSFSKVAQRVREVSGFVLTEKKRELVYNKLAHRLQSLNLSEFEAYCAVLDGPDGDDEAKLLISAITTNPTSFFRESHHFDHLSGLLSDIVDGQKTDQLRFWSAACSTGEEAYSIGMIVAGRLKEISKIDAKILATDIDTNVLTRARRAQYSRKAAESIPKSFRKVFTIQRPDGAIEIARAVRGLVHFHPLNLLDSWPMRGPFDAIFCRHVFVYLDTRDRERITNRFADMLPFGGWLYIGHTETLRGICDRFELVGRTTYRRVK